MTSGKEPLFAPKIAYAERSLLLGGVALQYAFTALELVCLSKICMTKIQTRFIAPFSMKVK